MISFTNEEKINIFDEIAAHFYNRNFGTLTKTDFDLMMFHFYIEALNQRNTMEGQLNYKGCSDYLISKELGITQQRVRNLKVKNHLVYPPEESDSWITSFASLVENARLDNDKIVISIPDPNLYIEIENYLEENGSYIEKQLNSKLMVMRIEYFIDVCLLFEDGQSRKEVIKKIKKQCREEDKDIKLFSGDNIGKSLIKSSLNISQILANIATCFSPGNIIADALIKLISKI